MLANKIKIRFYFSKFLLKIIKVIYLNKLVKNCFRNSSVLCHLYVFTICRPNYDVTLSQYGLLW